MDSANKDTATRILDAAERLFVEHGFEATSLRTITQQAEVNLAAVNYHFGSKKELIQAVLDRYLSLFMPDLDARLRVLPFGGHRVTGARVAFHTVQRSHGQGNGSYRAYASEDRDGGSRTVTLVLSLAAINGAPPAVHVPRPRNKRAMVQRAAAAAATAAAGSALSGAMA